MNLDDFLRRGLAAQRAVDEVLSREQQARELQADDTYRVRCMACGASVSTPLPLPVVVRALVECPDCLQLRAGRCRRCGGTRDAELHYVGTVDSHAFEPAATEDQGAMTNADGLIFSAVIVTASDERLGFTTANRVDLLAWIREQQDAGGTVKELRLQAIGPAVPNMLAAIRIGAAKQAEAR